MVNHNQQEEVFNQVSWVEVSQHQHGQRIDNFLFKHLKGVPKSRVYRILRKGEVRVNKGRIKPDYKLQLGDKIRLPPIRTAQANSGEIIVPNWMKAAITQPIFEDEALLVINKPAGLAAHGGSGIEFGLIEALRQLYPDMPFLELVHRLDRETSGCIVLAKSRSVLNDLHAQFRRESGQIDKSYLAILLGQLGEVKTIATSLLQKRDQNGIKRVVVDAAGQSAKSTFLPLKQLSSACYVRIQLHTGRMHQARVHAASMELPILGDKRYGNWDANRAMKSRGVTRCLLHAERYQLKHPNTGRQIQFKAPIPQDFSDVLQNLEKP